MKIILQSKRKQVYAEAEYQNGKVVVKQKSKIAETYSTNYKYSKKVEQYRLSTEYVVDAVVQKDIEFESLSTAAQFVCGCSTNGKRAWKLENGMSVGQFEKDVEKKFD